MQWTTTEALQFLPTGTQDHCHKWLALQGEFGSDFGSGFTCTQGDVRAAVSWGSGLCHLPAQLPVHRTTPRHPGAFLQKEAALPSPRGLKGSTNGLSLFFGGKGLLGEEEGEVLLLHHGKGERRKMLNKRRKKEHPLLFLLPQAYLLQKSFSEILWTPFSHPDLWRCSEPSDSCLLFSIPHSSPLPSHI